MPTAGDKTARDKQRIPLLMQAGKLQEALRLAVNLCRNHAGDGQNWFLLGAAQAQSGRLAEAGESLGRAAQLCPQMAVVHFNLAIVQQQLGELTAAEASIRRALQLNGGFPDAHLQLGSVLGAQGRLDEAATSLKTALRLRPQFPQAWCNLAALSFRRGEYADAQKHYWQALQQSPGMVDAIAGLAEVQLADGKIAAAQKLLEDALQGLSGQRRLVLLLGNLLGSNGQHADAARLLAEFVRANPADFEARNNLGNALFEIGQPEQAVLAYQAALAAKPDYVPALANLGKACREADQPQQAIVFCEQALRLKPDVAEIWYNLANSRKDLYQLSAAEAAYHKALALKPDLVEAMQNLGALLLLQGRVEEAVFQYEQACRAAPERGELISNYLLSLNYLPGLNAGQIFERHRNWGARFAACALPAETEGQSRPPGPLRVGLVSGDFRNHSVAFFIEALLRHHDRSTLAITGYSNVEHADGVTANLRSLAGGWCDIRALSDVEVAQRIRADAIDILVDLSGHTEGGRPGVFRCRPARVQVSYLGYPNTTGLPEINYRICDAVTDPVGVVQHATEQVVHLPGVFLCYTPPSSVSPGSRPARSAEAPVTFASFNNLAKVNARVLDTWAALLDRVPDSRLLLKGMSFMDEAVTDRFRQSFAVRGIAPERLDLRAWTRGLEDHLALYRSVDVALDTFPYNGTTTTCEALWMGVPVVTLSGDVHASRVGRSILTSLGLEQWIADSAGQYVDIAARLAMDSGRRRQEEQDLHSCIQESLLVDGQRHTSNMQQLLYSLWQQEIQD